VPDSRRIAEHEIRIAIEKLASEISQRHSGEKLFLLGIANGGIELARRLSNRLPESQHGTIDISFHRDDIGSHPIPKEFAPTHIPGDVNGALVILVDDVLFSGRTVKAALDELFDHGRPAKVELAILVDRGGLLLPFSPNYCGLSIPTGSGEKVSVKLHPNDPSQDAIIVRSSS
jgi:pyrimidine operon attenuation protein / uracil phosphoribosyltransferase